MVNTKKQLDFSNCFSFRLADSLLVLTQIIINPCYKHTAANDVADRHRNKVVDETADCHCFNTAVQQCNAEYGHVGNAVFESCGNEYEDQYEH